MPGMDGPALFAAISREWPHVAERVGFLTGDVLSTASAEFLATTSRPYAEKPFTPATVRRLIADVLGPASGC
jgi:CheY-like chemotaxis protein